MRSQAKFCFWFTENNTNFFSSAPKLPLIPKVPLSPKIKKIIFMNISMR